MDRRNVHGRLLHTPTGEHALQKLECPLKTADGFAVTLAVMTTLFDAARLHLNLAHAHHPKTRQNHDVHHPKVQPAPAPSAPTSTRTNPEDGEGTVTMFDLLDKLVLALHACRYCLARPNDRDYDVVC